MKKQFKTIIDESALIFERIYVSAGKRGYQVCLKVEDLVKAANAELKDVVKL